MHKVSDMVLCGHVPREKKGDDIKCPGKTLLDTMSAHK